MNDRNLEAELRAANPVSREAVGAMALEVGEEEMLDAIAAEVEPQPRVERAPRAGFRLPRLVGGLQLSRLPITLVASATAAAAIFLVVLSTGGGPAGRPATAAAAIRHLASVSPHILVTGPGWRIESAGETHGREGQMTFIRGNRPQSVLIEQEGFVAAVNRFAELQWRTVSARQLIGDLVSVGYVRLGSAPVLGTRAQIYSRPDPSPKLREYFAIWDDGGRALALRANRSDISAMRQHLALLRLVGADRWAAALEGEVVRTKAGVSVQPPK
ncbi:MAG TPA: hypothetical protein VFX45_02025 [Solirubrobacterales bacterium]|nr:hypothetical protein [Solirubrobacterales bacterium]